MFSTKFKLTYLNNKSHYFTQRNYNSFSQDEIIKMAKSKHNPPASKEWNNSFYAFNNHTTRNTPIKDSMITELIKNYFNLIMYQKTRKSKRMRDLIRRSTTKQIYISKTEIKQTNEKAIVTIYVFDREKQYIARRMFMWFKLLKNILISEKGYKIYSRLVPKRIHIKRYFKKNSVSLNMFLAPVIRKLLQHVFKKGIVLKRVIINGLVVYVYQNISFKDKHKQYLLYMFYKWALSIINIFITSESKKIKKNGKSLKKIDLYLIKNGEVLHKFKKEHLTNLHQLNNILLFLLIENGKISHKYIHYMWDIYINSNKYVISKKLLIRRFYKHASIGKYYLDYLNFGQRKMTTFVPYIKALLYKVYNKKIELNIINLRHLHLNTDTLIQAMSIKLKSKTSRLTTVLRRSLKLVRISDKYKLALLAKNVKDMKKKISSYKQLLDTYKGLNVTSLLNNNKIFYNLCSLLFFNLDYNKTLKDNIDKRVNKSLNSVKYKWVTGICLQTNGRLTKRYASARAIHKIRYNGSLQNFDYLEQNSSNIKPSVVLLRGMNKPNVQNSFITSNKRIGSFGIKGWVSGN